MPFLACSSLRSFLCSLGSPVFFALGIVSSFSLLSNTSHAQENQELQQQEPSSRSWKLAFAKSLRKERDYYRAISIYKELVFLSGTEQEKAFYLLAIADSYRQSQRFSLSIETAGQLLNMRNLPKEIQAKANLEIGASFLGMKVGHQAKPFLLRAQQGLPAYRLPEVFLATVALEQGQGKQAESSYRAVAHQEQGSHLGLLAQELAELSAKEPMRSSRSPWAAGILSTVVPGAGQAYTGHWVDAMQAFFFVGAFAVSSYASYRYEHEKQGPYVLTSISLALTSVFHIANIVGAERSARLFNQRVRETFVTEPKNRVLSLDFPISDP
jgi:hypothetical protein